MRAGTLKEVLHKQPFQPFAVPTVSDETCLVNHPDFVLVPCGGCMVIISVPGGEGERIRMVDTALTERIETKEVHQSN